MSRNNDFHDENFIEERPHRTMESLLAATMSYRFGYRFLQQDPAAASAFVASTLSAPEADKWLADLFLLARQRLMSTGVVEIYGGDQCTYSDPVQFYSYRRDGQTGRMSGLIWLMAQN